MKKFVKMLKLIIKFLLFTLILFSSSALAAQEICDNGMDDDNDGLIDLNDTECSCDETFPLTSVRGSICLVLELKFTQPEATSYQWYKDGIAITGSTRSVILLNKFISDVEGDYTVVATTPSGCISSEPHKVEIIPHFTDLGLIPICAGDTAFVGEKFYTTGGDKSFFVTASDGCDSFVNLTIKIDPNTKVNVSEEICPGSYFLFNTDTLRTPGNYIDTLSSSIGCDSIVNLSLDFGERPERILYDTICQGSNYDFYGDNYDTPGVYESIQEFPGICDTNFVLNLHVFEPTPQFAEVELCEGDIFEYNDLKETESGLYETTTYTNAGCEVKETFDVVFLKNSNYQIDTFFCSDNTIEIHGLFIDLPGRYEVTIENKVGCDSLITIEVLEEAIAPTNMNIDLCKGDTYDFYGQEISSTGIYYHTLVSSRGCDSIIVADAVVAELVEKTLDISICEGEDFYFKGERYISTGSHQIDVPNAQGCDSIYYLNIKRNLHTESYLKEQICEGDVYDDMGIYADESGIYETVIANAAGCDSVITIELDVLSPGIGMTEIEICEGESIDWNGSNYNEAGEYENILTSTYGCDSLSILNLIVNPIPTREIEQILCNGEPITVEGMEISNPGDFFLSKENPFGCDSIIFISVISSEEDLLLDLEDRVELTYGEEISLKPEILAGNYTAFYWYDESGILIGSDLELNSMEVLDDKILQFVAISSEGCEIQKRVAVDVELDVQIYVPNVIDPSGSEDIAYFNFSGSRSVSGIEKINIYDRWGELIYVGEHEGPMESYQGWDGQFNGQKVMPGVYTYHIIFNVVDGSQIQKAGSLTVIR